MNYLKPIDKFRQITWEILTNTNCFSRYLLQRLDQFLALGYLHGRQVQPHHLRLRVGQHERQQVTAAGAAQFQHARLFQRHGIQAVQMGGCPQMPRRSIRKGVRGVDTLVVGFGDIAIDVAGYCPKRRRKSRESA